MTTYDELYRECRQAAERQTFKAHKLAKEAGATSGSHVRYSSDVEPATDAQCTYLASLLDKAGMTLDERSLSKRRASQLIDMLKKDLGV